MEKTTSGTLVSADAAGNIVLSHKGNRGNTSHVVAKDAKVTLDGEDSSLNKLKAGDEIVISADDLSKMPASKVVATRE